MREKELSFSIFMIYSLADKWKMSPAKVYKILNSTGILDNYIIKCYDVLHTQKIWLRMNRSFLDNYGCRDQAVIGSTRLQSCEGGKYGREINASKSEEVWLNVNGILFCSQVWRYHYSSLSWRYDVCTGIII